MTTFLTAKMANPLLHNDDNHRPKRNRTPNQRKWRKIYIHSNTLEKDFPTRMGIRFTHRDVICFTTYGQNDFIITQNNNCYFIKQDSHGIEDQALNAGK